ANLENIVKKDILVFPNPASSILHIQGIQPNIKIQLISPTGVVVYEQKNNSSNVIVNILELSTGVYWLNVSDHNNTMVTRMITIE
ncbi:MAG: T9SS type A sorting domain-containing protein, partial [Bacteroidia bacterium]|nr:T9SS type A sorting domain-containing protein [Bacteroidia bacterium]